jgi:hypothetical protein
MKLQNVILTSILCNLSLNGLAQGFVNLDFESANVAGYSSPNFIPTSDALPGWTAYLGGSPQSNVLYNNATLGAAAVSLQGTNGVFSPIAGSFSALLQATFFASVPESAAVGQTAQIPIAAQSLVFWANTSLSGVTNDMRITFNGSSVPYSAIGNGTGYTIYGASIPSLAGQTGQLLFTAFNNTYAEIDNIQFLNQPIPEPSAFGLAALGVVLTAWRFVRRRVDS